MDLQEVGGGCGDWMELEGNFLTSGKVYRLASQEGLHGVSK